MDREIIATINLIVQKYTSIDILEISGERWRIAQGEGTHTTVRYPEFDVCERNLDKKFDLIIAEMVFEHLRYPFRAGKNVFSMLENKGFFLISVPFLYPIHKHPIDCTRWSQEGLKYFLEEVGFNPENINVDSWGNSDCVRALLETDRPIDFNPAIHSLINDPKYPVSVWGIAQK